MTSSDRRDPLVIRCDRFRALIIDSQVSSQERTSEFLRKLDTIIFLQWTTETDAILNDLLSCLTDGHFEDPDSLHLKCLILPRHFGHSSRPILSNSTTHSGCYQSRSIVRALRLGIIVLQLSPAFASNQRYVQCMSHSDHISFRKNIDSQMQSVRGRFFGTNSVPMRKTVLYHKLGTGTLYLIPIFMRQNDAAQPISSFCALLVWQPVTLMRGDWGPVSRPPASRYVLVSPSSYSRAERPHSAFLMKPETGSFHLPAKVETANGFAIKQLRSFVSQMSSHIVPTQLTQPQGPRSGFTSSRLRTGLSQSCTYSSGFMIPCSPKPGHPYSKKPDPHVASKESVTDSNYTTALDSKGQANFCEIVQPVKNSPENQYIVQSTVDLGSCDGNIYDRSLKDVVLLNTPSEVNCNRFIDSETSNSRTEKETPAWLLSSIPYDSTNNENNHALRPKNSTHVTHVPKWPGRMDQIIKSELISNADSVDIIPKSPSFPNTMELSKMASFTNDSASLSRPDAIWSEIGSTAYSATVLLAIPECGEADYYAESPQYLTVDDLRAMGLYDDSDDSEEDGELERHSKGDGNEAHAFDNTSEKDQKNRSQNLCSSDVQNGSRPQERIAVSEELRVPDRGVAEETLYTETLADINSFGLFNATSHGIDRVQEKLDAFC